MIKKILKIVLVVTVIALIASVTMQIIKDPQLLAHKTNSEQTTKVTVGEEVDYTVYITTNWFSKPSTKFKVTPETDNLQVISNEISLNSVGFSSATWKVTYRIVPVDDHFKVQKTVISAKAKSLFNNKERSISIDLKPIQVIPLAENESAEVQSEKLIDKNLVAIDPDKSDPTRVIIIVIAFILLTIFMLIKWFRQRKKEQMTIPPWTIALNALNVLDAELPMAIELFYVQSTDILRLYIEALYKLPATESTTPEFIKTLTNDKLLMPSTKKMLTEFLKQADMIKFAKQSSSEEQMRDALQSIRQLINETTAKHLEQEESNA